MLETEQTPQIDLTYLYELTEGNNDTVVEMLQIFVNTVPPAIEEIKQAIEKHDWTTVRVNAHRIKPSFGFIGASGPEAMLRQIEISAMELPDAVLMRKLITEVDSQCKLCLEEIKNVIAGNT